MLDIKYIRENAKQVETLLAKKSASLSLASILDLDQRRRDLLGSVETLKKERNENSKKIANQNLTPQEKQECIQATKEIGNQIKIGDEEIRQVEEEITQSLLPLPNLPAESVPDGEDEQDNKEIRKQGTPTSFSFPVQHHADLAEKLGILDFQRGVKLAHSRFTLVKNTGAKLERALIQFMLDIQTKEHGYIEIMPPLLANHATLQGTGQLPKFEDDLFQTTDGLYLIPTAEVVLTNMHRDEIIPEASLPLAYTAYTPCFRKEAGSYGRDTKGYIRQHQFNKVEMVQFTHPSQSFAILDAMQLHACRILDLLELPYRVVELCSGDLGFSAAKCYDIEVWLPSENTYREISSCSNCTDFQARRANIRFKGKGTDSGKSKTEFVHTLNGSGLAVGRTLVAILENYQQEDGSVQIPSILQPYMDMLQYIKN